MPLWLTPFSWLYQGLGRLRSFTSTSSVAVPVICVGNVVAGGAGKTPVAVALAEFFKAEGKIPHFLSRGYGGKMKGPVRVVLDVHSFSDVGDEALILAAVTPTWVSSDRVKGAAAAANAGADVIIMDDGFQNPSLHKDLSLLVLDARYGVGNGRLLPAGPLRESLADGLARADAVVMVGDRGNNAAVIPDNFYKPVFKAKLVPTAIDDAITDEEVVAFAGIGRPEKFFDSLLDVGCNLIKCFSYADHHVYTQQEIMEMVELAAGRGATLVTTRKDYVRLPVEAKMMVTVFDVELNFEAPRELQRLLRSAVAVKDQRRE